MYEAKTNLSNLVKKVRQGSIITLCNNGEPVAQIIPFKKEGSAWGKLGVARDLIGSIPSDFNDELTDEELPGFLA